MKSVAVLFMFLGLAKQCSKIDTYSMLDKNNHPAIVHNMELTLAGDLNSDDSATALWAKEFLAGFETEFKNYHPDKKIIDKLKKFSTEIQVKVIGGNWCSDTKREVPRLCKILYYMGVDANKFEYYRVDRNKKPVEPDFASSRTIGAVPDMVIYKNGTEVGRIVEVPNKTLEKDLLNILK
ncbi:MAG: thioredoxin family protein [Bacteroidia bacterium]|nr:thioredoxin family protein [Bacteroidia bacterium]